MRDSEGGSATGLQVLCPVCGAAVDLQEPPRPALGTAETGTYHPVGADQSEAETLAPKPPPGSEDALEVLPAPEASIPIPEIPGYVVLGELGRGGMGMVYKARQTKLERLVALKILPQETSSDSSFAERFTREARALARLNHSNIVTVYDFGQAGTLSYFVMEFVDGVNLRQLLRSSPIAPRETLQIMSQICDALQYAHDEGIVHRDIKPENILRDKRGRVKIADFGIAKLLARKTTDYTLTGPWQVVGTFNYMAPEQIENPLKLDHRADIYSLGVMFYEMLTGGLPMGRFAMPSQKADLDRRIDEIVLKALEKEPEHRYQQVRELKAAIDAFLASGAFLASEASHGPGPRTPVGAGSVSARPIPTTSPDELHPSPVAGMTTWPREYPSAIPVGLDREQIRQRLHGLATGLKVAGIVHCVCWGLFIATAAAAERLREAGGLAAIGLLPGVAIIVGAKKIQKLESYQFGILSCFLAMIPCSPGFLIGLPMGIWTLAVLRRPEVRAAFGGGQLPVASIPTPVLTPIPPQRKKGLFRKTFGTTTGWAMIFCVLGSLCSAFLPWSVETTWQVPGVLALASHHLMGFECRFGVLTAMTFLLLFLVLIATGFLEPIPVWRPACIFIAGIVAIFFAVAEHDSTGRSLFVGAYFAIATGLALLLLGALQVRRILIDRRTAS
jgi:serine/threonine protein kinase